MNTNTPQATHTFSTPLFTFTGTIKPVQAHQPSHKPNKQFDNLLVYVPSLKTAVRFDSHLNAFGYASHLKSIYPLIKVGIYGNDRLIDTLDAK